MLLSMNDEVSLISSQIADQTEAIHEVVLSEVSKLIDSVKSKRQEDQKKHNFFRQKGLHKIENGLTINKHTETSYQLMNRVIKKTNYKFYKKIFHISKCAACSAEKTLELR